MECINQVIKIGFSCFPQIRRKMFTMNILDFQDVRKEDQYKIYLRSNDVLSLSFWEHDVSSPFDPLDWNNLFAKNRKQKKPKTYLK